MTHSTIDALIALIGSVITGTVGWVVKRNQENTSTLSNHDKRIALCEQAFVDLKELINSRFDGLEGRQDRVERSLNGFLHRD